MLPCAWDRLNEALGFVDAPNLGPTRFISAGIKIGANLISRSGKWFLSMSLYPPLL